MKDQKTKEEFIELRVKGLSFADIAEKLGVSKQTLINWSKEFQFDIQNMRAIESEALQKKFCLSAEYRLDFFRKQLEKITHELNQKDYSDLPADKLLGLGLKLMANFDERIGIKFVKKDWADLDIQEKVEWSV
jgi:transposase